MNPQDPEYKPKTIYSEPNQTVTQPEVYNSPNLSTVPYGAQASPQPNTAPTANSSSKGSKGPLIAIIVVAAIFLIVVGVVLATGGSKKKTTKDTSTTKTDAASVLQPAQAIELEQTNNAVSQDLSGLDDEKDFPASSLEDKTLGL